MRENLIKSIILGIVLGTIIALSQVDVSSIGLVISVLACVIAGLITVLMIQPKPNLYSLIVITLASMLACISYGLSNGLVYSAGIATLYGVISVQLFQASINTFDNVKYLIRKFNKKQ